MDEERIPTMPQGERIPTMPQGERIPTMPQGKVGADGRIATVPQNLNKGQGTSEKGLILTGDLSFSGEKGGKFIIQGSKVISSNSGESQIYSCHSENGKEKYVARVLISVTPESDMERRLTRSKVINFLDGASRNEDSHILPLIDHGTITAVGHEYYVEIYPFCGGGDLGNRKGKITYKELQEEIIPGVNEALKEFHEGGFVHRDVKPDNLYKYNNKVVLGDFGITCDLREDGFATDKFKTGTLGYYAPELMSQAAIKASDYYAFGQTIWTLYSGEMMYGNILRRYKGYGMEEQRNQVNFAMLNSVYYGLDEISKEDNFLEVLIRGLLRYDPVSRFDYDKVKRWLQGDRSIGRDMGKYEGKAVFTTPFRYNNRECWDNGEIYEVLRSQWENAKDLLYSGSLKKFYSTNDYGIASEIEQIMKNYSTVRAGKDKKVDKMALEILNDVGLSRFFMILNGGKTLVWRNREYNSFGEISTQIIKENGQNPFFTDLLSSELPGYWYQLQTSGNGGFDTNMADAIANIRALAASQDDWVVGIAYSATYYMFLEDMEQLTYNGCKSLEELADKIAEDKVSLCRNARDMVYGMSFYGFIFALGYEDNGRYLIQNVGGDTFNDLEMFFDFIFAQLKDKKIYGKLLKAYLEKGPSSYLYWWKNNMDMYQCNSAEAKKLETEIKNARLDGSTLKDLRAQFEALNQLSVRFRSLFTDNVFLTRMGISGGKNGVTSNRIEAYWHYNFLNREAPLGFIKYIGKEV